MLFRPPDFGLFCVDRAAFLLLVVALLLRALFFRQSPVLTWATFPMIGLLMMGFVSAISQPFNAQTWSLFAAKFLVPFSLFHLAGLAFEREQNWRHFETFALVALAYLSFISIAQLVGATSLIFPRYILDENLGIHADRARGPLLQAVAHGVSLNLLGLIALHSYGRGRLRGILAFLMLGAMPLAILATMTRAVWLSFALSILLLLLFDRNKRMRRACLAIACAGLAVLAVAFGSARVRAQVVDRLGERSALEFRLAVYDISLEMIGEKPLLGWGQNQMPAQIGKRMMDYRPETYCAHNSYLEILVEQGAVGLVLYGWIIFCLLRLANRQAYRECSSALPDQHFRSLWPVLLSVYFVNASFVVMNYQFVNALLFTVAGILAGQNHRSSALRKCP
jgi:O-antigen ligase